MNSTVNKYQQAPALKKNDAEARYFFQPKLSINNFNDKFEKEADAITAEVTPFSPQSFLKKVKAPGEKQNIQLQPFSIVTNPSIQRVPASSGLSGQSQLTPVIAPQVRYRPTGTITRAEFDNYVQTYFGVSSIHTGTQPEQEQRITRHGVPPPTIPTWQSWDPGSASEDYTSIIDGMEQMINGLGALPQVNTIIFFKIEYEPDTTTGVGIPHANTGASFGAGELVVYEAFSGSTNPAAAISSAQGTPIRTQNRSGSISDTIIHELGHGVGEAASNNSPVMFQQYNAAVGWQGNPAVLYDIGQPAVRAAIAAGTAIDAQYIITSARWNDATVSEQPMSRYAVQGGPGEDFAESIAAYITAPSVLRQRSPWRYQFINTNMADWITRMRAMRPGMIRPPLGDFPMPSSDTRNV